MTRAYVASTLALLLLTTACNSEEGGDTDANTGGEASTSGSSGDTPTTAASQGMSASTNASSTTAAGETGSDSSGDDEPETPSTGDTGGSYPACLDPLLLIYMDALGPACEGFDVRAYTFQGQQVFVLDSTQCGFFDQVFPVYTEDCTQLCSLYGHAGTTDCNDEAFYDQAVENASWPYPG